MNWKRDTARNDFKVGKSLFDVTEWCVQHIRHFEILLFQLFRVYQSQLQFENKWHDLQCVYDGGVYFRNQFGDLHLFLEMHEIQILEIHEIQIFKKYQTLVSKRFV